MAVERRDDDNPPVDRPHASAWTIVDCRYGGDHDFDVLYDNIDNGAVAP